MYYTLRIIHISDLHERGPREAETWRRRRVLGDTWKKNLDAFMAEGPIDLVCFTGDATDWGKEKEYNAASDFFRALMEHLGLPMDRLFLIPGNHDIDRSIHSEYWEKLRDTFLQGDGLTLSRWLAGIGLPPPGAKSDWLDAVLARQTAYRDWIKTLGREELDPASNTHGRVGYRHTPDLPDLPFPVQVIGLDTAWLAGDNYDAQKLWLTDDQIMRHTTDVEGNPLPGLRLALCHHPLWDLADHHRAANLLAKHTDVLLRGHLHHPALQPRNGFDRDLVEMAAGCLYEGHRADRYPNGCQLISLNLDASGRPVSIEPWFRAWSEEGHWHDDDSRYDKSKRGRLEWFFSAPVRMVGNNPYDFTHPVVPPHFIGREALLASLEQALDETASVSLIGDRRIGKSSVLETFRLRAQEMGRTVVLLTGIGREAASLSAFVLAVTGHTCPDNADRAADALSVWVEKQGRPGLVPLLLLDEAEIFIRQFDYRFFERLRGMLDRLCLVLATNKPIDQLFKQMNKGSPFDYKLRIERLGLLEHSAANALVQRGGENLDGEDHELMRRWAGRNPYYLQLLGYRLVEARQMGETREIALDKAWEDAYARLRSLWANLNDREQDALHNAAAGTPSNHRGLRGRGLLEENELAFGEVLSEWMNEEDPR